ncbi:hypothetical protein [Rhizobium tubonense]|uniref:hypothetical protein n=1 Tax=Rhizobium tubonense TaxID=484088 RepID=UPI001FCEB922|nr:hypothetical protein [Rhizobium tubonense]
MALGVQVATLFGDDDGTALTSSGKFGSEDFAISKEGIYLNKAFLKIKDAGVRSAVIGLLVALGKAS